MANLAKYQNSPSFFRQFILVIARAATYCYMVRFNSPLVCAKCRYCNTLRNNVSVLSISIKSPARMKALLPLLDSAIYFYTRDNHGLQPLR